MQDYFSKLCIWAKGHIKGAALCNDINWKPAAPGFLTAALQSQGKETSLHSWGHAQPPAASPAWRGTDTLLSTPVRVLLDSTRELQWLTDNPNVCMATCDTLEGTVLGFHCKASYFPIKSHNSVRILGLLISVSQKPKGSRLTSDIFYSCVSIRRSEDKHWKLPEISPRILVLPGLFGSLAGSSLGAGFSHLGERLDTEECPRPLQEHPSLPVLWCRHKPWKILPELCPAPSLPGNTSFLLSQDTALPWPGNPTAPPKNTYNTVQVVFCWLRLKTKQPSRAVVHWKS